MTSKSYVSITTVWKLQHKSLRTKRNYYKLIRHVRTLNMNCVVGYVVSASGDQCIGWSVHRVISASGDQCIGWSSGDQCIGWSVHRVISKKRCSDLLHRQRPQRSTNFHLKHSLLRSEGAKMKEMFTANL